MAGSHSSDKLTREIDEYALRMYKSDCKDPNYQRPPRCWNIKDRSRELKLSHFALTVTNGGSYSERHESNHSSHEAACVRSDVHIPLTTGIYYFEVTLSHKGGNGRSFAVGVATKGSNISKLPGSEPNSFGYHSDGSIYNGSLNTPINFGPRLCEYDTVGCGVDFVSRSLFFTRNGVYLGKAFEGKIPANPNSRLYPAVGLQGRGARVTTNFGQRLFNFAFDAYIKRERMLHEDTLLDRVCKEEFAGTKMRDLVSGYLVHHGYVASAQAFSRWSSLPMTATQGAAPISTESNLPGANDSAASASQSIAGLDSTPDVNGLQARSCELPLGISRTTEQLSRTSSSDGVQRTGSIPRRHSDSSCITLTGVPQLPGIASMLHRRRLRALCRRCQYGRAATTLNRLYPQVLERCPELLVQLRCRQLIEMMRRHAVRRGRTAAFGPVSDSASSPTSAAVPPKVQKFSDSKHVRSHCCISSKSPETVSSTTTNNTRPVTIELGPPKSTDPSQAPSTAFPLSFPTLDVDMMNDRDADCSYEEFDEVTAADDDDDDDGFGFDDEEETGVCIKSICLSSRTTPSPVDGSAMNDAATVTTADRMEVDLEPSGSTPSRTKVPPASASKSNGSNEVDSVERDEMLCLLRHVQFGRSLVNLVKQIRSKTGGLSLETEQLLQQSVSMLAYPSPGAVDCPLRNLLDPTWRDTTANMINSAVLKAHDLPAQPALEQGLRALQRALQDKNFVEAQTLGHLLLYHLTPNQLTRAEDDALPRNATSEPGSSARSSKQQQRVKSSASKLINSTAGEKQSSTPQNSASNGHLPVGRRRSRRHEQVDTDETNNNRGEVEDGSSSSMEEVLNKHDEDGEDDEDDDDDDDDDNTDEGSCRIEDLNDDDDDDDDLDDAHTSTSLNRRRRAHERGTASSSSTTRGSTSVPLERSPNGGQSASDRAQSEQMLPTTHRVRQFSTVYRPGETIPTHLRPYGRHTVFARCCPATLLVDPTTHARILAPMSPMSGTRRTVVNRFSTGRFHETIVPVVQLDASAPTSSTSSTSGATIRTRDSEQATVAHPPPPNQYLDSAFSGLLSMSYPRRAEFLAAMNDALKVYAGSLLVSEDPEHGSASVNASGRGNRHPHGPPPPPPGGSACAP